MEEEEEEEEEEGSSDSSSASSSSSEGEDYPPGFLDANEPRAGHSSAALRLERRRRAYCAAYAYRVLVEKRVERISASRKCVRRRLIKSSNLHERSLFRDHMLGLDTTARWLSAEVEMACKELCLMQRRLPTSTRSHSRETANLFLYSFRQPLAGRRHCKELGCLCLEG